MAITKMKNGRWRVSVYQPNDAPRIRKVFKTREEARKFENITKGELALGKTFYTKKNIQNSLGKNIEKPSQI